MLSDLTPPRGRDFQDRPGWTVWLLLAIPLLFLAGILIRLSLLQSRGLVGDIDQFVVWVHGIAVDGWNRAYDQNLSFPAVMAWIWGGLAAIQPAFQTVTDSSDPGIRSLMKVPATLADLGIAAAVVWWFRDRPKLAVLAAGAVLLWPAVWYVSAWWGQCESLYVLPVLAAWFLVTRGRFGWAAVALAIGLMAKPQALPLAVPFAAYYLRRTGLRGSIRAGLAGAGLITLGACADATTNADTSPRKALETYIAAQLLSRSGPGMWWISRIRRRWRAPRRRVPSSGRSPPLVRSGRRTSRLAVTSAVCRAACGWPKEPRGHGPRRCEGRGLHGGFIQRCLPTLPPGQIGSPTSQTDF
jgi:hypothetical protein